MERLERLINLVAALLDAERPLTADELRNRVPGYADSDATFRRAFERDKEVLRELGVPIQLELVDAGPPRLEGYRIPRESYELADPGLDPDELAALHLAATAVHLEGARGVEALWKLGGAVAEAGPAPPVATLPGAAHLGSLFRAISERRVARFAYRDSETTRSVDPYRLSFRNGHWYLAGLDHDRAAERSFRLDRIRSDVEIGETAGTFEPPRVAGPPAPPWQMGDDAPVEARVLVDAGQAGWVLGQLGPAALEQRLPDGSVIVRLEVRNRPAFRSFVLGFLDHAVVLGPPALRDEMIAWLELGPRTDPAPADAS